MLHLDDPTHDLSRALLDAAGGFAWWYADALDEKGTGFVVIGAWGLPFLPGDRAARLAGHAPRTGDRPSLNLAVYEDGQPAAYTLYEVPPDRAAWVGDVRRFGDTTMTLRPDGMDLSVDLPIPGEAGRWRGEIAVRGPAVLPDGAPPTGDTHLWTPLLGPARATGHFDLGGGHRVAIDGDAYLDRNGSPLALDAMGIEHWTWGRQILGDELVIHYLTWPSDPLEPPVLVLVTVDREGRRTVHRDARVQLDDRRRTTFGMPWWREVHVQTDQHDLHVTYDLPVDVGPFYLRATTTARMNGHTARGWAELCRPDRIDLTRHRFLVNMAVQREAGPTSLWTPLFVGPRATRCGRLARSWAQRLSGRAA